MYGNVRTIIANRQNRSYKILHFHNNHVIKCPACGSYLLWFSCTRVFSNSRREKQHKCMECGRQFMCCANIGKGMYSLGKHKVSLVRSRIATYKYMIKKLEKEIEAKYY